MQQLKRVMFAFGTRPEAIKIAPVINEIYKHSDIFAPIVVVTAQHREMLDQTLKIFDIKPDYDLDIMEQDQTISNIVTKTLQGFEDIILQERPDMVIVQGDTSTAFASALAAFYRKVPVGHIEAGLRTKNKFNPFPEEMNRKLISAIADMHFAPTEMSVNNLLSESVSRSNIFLTGNTVIDALLSVVSRPYDLKRSGVSIKPGKKLILVTTHRRESFGIPMRNALEAIAKIAKKFGDEVQIVLPVHKNPNVRDVVFDVLDNLPNVDLVEPMDYLPFVHLMKESYIILTDSGGIQEEAPSLGKPVLVLREITERPEAVLAGTVKIVGTDPGTIFNETQKLLTDKDAYDKMSHAVNPYGDGNASSRIITSLLKHFGFTDRKVEEFDFRNIAPKN
ncbi:MAG: UDP-N-acetylglucosamine 2-epimerase (non-hydrolyzing) [Candidatus Saganbacteria bacterium]|nr:UDP-N-acetylglucosamine 2-epimerase (non-hydrolyzing) [Candidatus Saganbacteria bacterium]